MSARPVRIWPVPIALGVASAVGLVIALVADGLWDHLSTAALTVPVAVSVWFMFRPRRGGGEPGK